MFLNKLKAISAVLLVILCIGGAGTLVSRAVRADAATQDPGQASNEDREQTQKLSYRIGDFVSARFFFRNAGENPIHISYPSRLTQSYYKALGFTDSKGEDIPFRQAHQRPEPVGWLGGRLAPGEYAETDGDPLSLDNAAAKQLTVTVLCVEPGHSYGVRYTLPNYADSKADDLRTGKFTFTVIEKGAPRSKHATEAELKKCIAWGTPGKNGLQVGVLLLPVKDENPTGTPAPAEDPARRTGSPSREAGKDSPASGTGRRFRRRNQETPGFHQGRSNAHDPRGRVDSRANQA